MLGVQIEKHGVRGTQRKVLLAEYLTSREKKREREEAREKVDMNWLQRGKYRL